MERYLEEQGQQKIFSIRERDARENRYKGRVIVQEYGVSVTKDDKEIYLSWQELELILGLREGSGASVQTA